MQPAGLREVEAAKADGRWQRAYDSPSTISMPPDLAKALRASPKAKAFFTKLDSLNRYAVLYRVQTASEKVRATRIGRLITMLERGETVHPMPSARKPAKRKGTAKRRR
jgi:uncharacterized protein YdeI (YjbR/CyaY-like superfamily)